MLQKDIGKVHPPVAIHSHGEPITEREAPSRLGMWMSLLCAVHCAVLPLFMVMVPALGSSFIASEPVEWAMLAVAVGIALWSITRGYVRDHRRAFPAWILGGGVALVILGHTVIPHEWEAVASVAGSLAIAAAQFINLRLVRRFHRCETHH